MMKMDFRLKQGGIVDFTSALSQVYINKQIFNSVRVCFLEGILDTCQI